MPLQRLHSVKQDHSPFGIGIEAQAAETQDADNDKPALSLQMGQLEVAQTTSSEDTKSEQVEGVETSERYDTEPRWEAGIVAAGGLIPDYPAADESNSRFLGLPYFIYRGDVFRLGDRGAARGIIANEERFEIDLGIDAALDVDSDDNDAREGMDNLDFLLELGPRGTYRLLPKSDRDEFNLSLSGRAVISTDFANWRYQGIMINPAVTYRRNDLFDKDIRASFSIGGLIGLNGVNRYFYRVAPSEARPGRNAFEADNGYLGTEASTGVSWLITDNLRVFGGVQLGFWGGSANDDSPLHRQDVTATVGGGLRWTFLQSDERVRR